MSFLKQLLGKYLGSHQGSGGHGNKHGGYGSGKHGQRYGYSEPTQSNPVNSVAGNPGKTCPTCRVNNLSDAKFCQQCGTSLAPVECSQCRTVLLADAKFCPQCGKARG